MRSLHEVCTNHGECNAVSVLCWKLHALLKLVLKYRGVETENKHSDIVQLRQRIQPPTSIAMSIKDI